MFDGWFLIHYINTSPLSVTLDLQSVRESLYDCITSYVHIISYMVWLYHILVTGEDGTPRLPSSGLTEEEKVVEEGKPVTLKWGDDGDDGGDGDGSDG